MWIGVSVPPAPEPATASAGPGPPASCVARDALAVVSRRARNRRHRSSAITAVPAGTSRPLPAPPPPHEAGYVPRLRPGTGRQPAAARPGSTVGREGGTKFSASCVRDGQTASCAEISNLGCNGSLRLSFRMRCGCSGRRSECERFDGSNGSRAGSVPLAHGPSQYPGHTGRVSTPGTQAESVPLAHGPDQSPGSRAESVPNRQQSKHALSSAHGPAVTLAIWNPGAPTNAALVPSPGPGAFTSAKASPALAGPWPPRPPWLVPSAGPGAISATMASPALAGPWPPRQHWLVPSPGPGAAKSPARPRPIVTNALDVVQATARAAHSCPSALAEARDAPTTTARAKRPPGRSATAWCRPDYRPGPTRA